MRVNFQTASSPEEMKEDCPVITLQEVLEMTQKLLRERMVLISLAELSNKILKEVNTEIESQ